MSLSLDARQRAMLREMGITVWSPLPVPGPASAAPMPAAETPATLATPPATPRPPAPTLATAPTALPATPEPARPRPALPPAATPAAARPGTGLAMALTVHAPQVLYPDADPARTPAGLGRGWLIVTDSVPPQAPLSGDAGRLLDNLLRAMQLHRHPQVHLVALERGVAQDAAADPGAIAHQLTQLALQWRPSMVLLLGHVAARAALGGNEPLGRLRAVPHRLGDSPALVSYDPAFLLRSQGSKAAAWADCCQALARVRQAEKG